MTDLKRVMVVEDDPDILEILELSLGTLGGFEVSLHSHARPALLNLDRFAPQLIVLDVMLPDISGPQALQLLRQQTIGQKALVVFLTANASAGVREQYLALGAQEVLFKPFDPVQLPVVLQNLWATWVATQAF
jgi:CheY-like chemotaxis protein